MAEIWSRTRKGGRGRLCLPSPLSLRSTYQWRKLQMFGEWCIPFSSSLLSIWTGWSIWGRKISCAFQKGLAWGAMVSPVMAWLDLFSPVCSCVIMTELLVLPQLKIKKQMLSSRHGHAGACQATVSGSRAIQAIYKPWGRTGRRQCPHTLES